MRIFNQIKTTLGSEYDEFLKENEEVIKGKTNLTDKTEAENIQSLERKLEGNKQSPDMLIKKIAQSKTKEEVRIYTIRLYKSLGYDNFINSIDKLKKIPFPSETVYLKGEVAETVLEIIISVYKKKHGLTSWRVLKSFIISMGSYTTELDFVLATPVTMTIMEVKSYDGNKELVKECTIKRGSKSFDVYEQNRKHIKAFFDKYGQYNRITQGAFKSVLFSYASGSLVDNREPEYKQIMPVYTVENITNYLNILRQIEVEPRWEYMQLLKRIMKDYKEGPTMADHMESIKKLKENSKRR